MAVCPVHRARFSIKVIFEVVSGHSEAAVERGRTGKEIYLCQSMKLLELSKQHIPVGPGKYMTIYERNH